MRKFLFLLLTLFVALDGFAQITTRIRGSVVDAETKEPLPFVNITFAGTSIGTTTDIEGSYSIETGKATIELKASFVGYDDQFKPVNIGKIQRINFKLNTTHIELKEVTIVAKRLKYKNRGNPAVRVIRRVIDNSLQKRLSTL